MCRDKKFFSYLIILCLSLFIFGCSGLFEDDEKPKPKPKPQTPDAVVIESVSTFSLSGRVVDEVGDLLPGVLGSPRSAPDQGVHRPRGGGGTQRPVSRQGAIAGNRG